VGMLPARGPEHIYILGHSRPTYYFFHEHIKNAHGMHCEGHTRMADKDSVLLEFVTNKTQAGLSTLISVSTIYEDSSED